MKDQNLKYLDYNLQALCCSVFFCLFYNNLSCLFYYGDFGCILSFSVIERWWI